MKNLLTSLFVLAFFVPCVSFAQTASTTTYSPQYVALLQQLIKLLEQEVQISLANQNSISATTTATTSTPVASTPTTSSTTGSISTPLNYTPIGDPLPQQCYNSVYYYSHDLCRNFEG